MNELVPTAGQWYVRPDGLKFEVIDVDEDGLIEVQSEDGTLDEIDAEDWPTINVELSTQSEDASATYDNVPLPDEADGGDAGDTDSAALDLLRVANEDDINSAGEDDEMDESPDESVDDESEDRMEQFTSNQRERP